MNNEKSRDQGEGFDFDATAPKSGEGQGKNPLLQPYLAALLADREAFRLIAAQARIATLKQQVMEELASASKIVRIRSGQIPGGLYFEGAALRAAKYGTTVKYRVGRSQRRQLQNSAIFDSAFYLSQNRDVAASGMDPFEHFLSHGLSEERDPNPLFSNGWYRLSCGTLGGAPPLIHFLNEGQGRGISPHPLFSPTFYIASNKIASLGGRDPFTHFLQEGAAKRFNPHPLILMQRLAARPELADCPNPLARYLSDSSLFQVSVHPLFDSDFYLADHRDVARLGCNPLLHYCAIGWRQGRQPHRLFAGDWYLANNPDVLAADVNPLEHFILQGAFERRSPHPLFDINYYVNECLDARKASCDPLTHYLSLNEQDKFETTAKISVRNLREATPRAYWSKYDPVSAFMSFGHTGISAPSYSDNIDLLLRGQLRGAWPSAPAQAYWLPQELHNFISDRYGEKALPPYHFLMSIVARFGDQPEAFSQSNELKILTDRLNRLAREKAAPDERRVDASIVIPVHNNLVFTLTSVVSILENNSRFVYEILIGDDASTDETAKVFAAAGGAVSIVRHEKNLGFIGNCNVTAQQAKGRFVVFLNNDTLTLPGWLDELILCLNDEKVGLAGSKLLNADGTLQEAGGIYWQDGSAWNFGRNSDPRQPEFNYSKDVDYVSGASIALPMDLWRRLDGFDTVFSPAYCEDADLAFRVRAAGFRTVYAPMSEVIHHEGKSHGRDVEGGVKAYQVVNQAKLVARWRDVFARDHFPNAEKVFLARDRSRRKLHLLFVDHYIPQWDQDAGSRATFHVLRMLREADVQITFWSHNLFEDKPYCAPLQRMGVEVIYGNSYVERFESFMKENGKYYDYAILGRPHIAIAYYDAIRAFSNCKILYYGHDIHFQRMELEHKITHSQDINKEIAKMRTLEMDNWKRSDLVVYFSTAERDAVRRLLPDKAAEQVPLFGYTPDELSVARDNIKGFDQRDPDVLLFVGGSHPPNVDALLWCAREIMPLVLRKRPRAQLHVVGATKNAEVARLGSSSIVLRGRLSDDELSKLYKSAGAALIPLRFGGGVKGKTIEALLHATPLVSTSVGMQGLDANAPIAFVADSAEAFAEAILLAQTAREEARANVLRGIAFVEQNYSIDALRRSFAHCIPQLALDGTAASPDSSNATKI